MSSKFIFTKLNLVLYYICLEAFYCFLLLYCHYTVFLNSRKRKQLQLVSELVWGSSNCSLTNFAKDAIFKSMSTSTPTHTHTHTIEGAPSKAVVYAQCGAFSCCWPPLCPTMTP